MGAKNWPTKYIQNVISLKSQLTKSFPHTCLHFCKVVSYMYITYQTLFLFLVKLFLCIFKSSFILMKCMETSKSENSTRDGTVSRAVALNVVWTSQTDCFHINDIKSNPWVCFVTVSLNQLWAMQTSIAWSTVRRYSLLSDQLGKQ